MTVDIWESPASRSIPLYEHKANEDWTDGSPAAEILAHQPSLFDWAMAIYLGHKDPGFRLGLAFHPTVRVYTRLESFLKAAPAEYGGAYIRPQSVIGLESPSLWGLSAYFEAAAGYRFFSRSRSQEARALDPNFGHLGTYVGAKVALFRSFALGLASAREWAFAPQSGSQASGVWAQGPQHVDFFFEFRF